MNYPKKHEDLLRKAGLLGTGFLEVRAIHNIRTMSVSEDGMTYETVKRPDAEDILSTSTSPVYDSAGNIAGYWATGLTVEEREIINKECGVPYCYLGDREVNAAGKYVHPDTRLSITEGQIFDLSVPADVAMVRLLAEVISTIGMNEREARDNNARFFFYSREEEKKAKDEAAKKRRNAAKLVDELSTEAKVQVVKILSFDGDIPVDPYSTKEALIEVFDEVAFTMPEEVLRANDVLRKEDYICCSALIHAGYIEKASADGPFYKNPTVYGQRTHLADSFDQLLTKINSYSDLIKSYRDLSSTIKGEHTPAAEKVHDATVLELFKRHGMMGEKEEGAKHEEVAVITGENYAYEEASKKVRFMKVADVIKAMDEKGIEHNFTLDSDSKEVKEYYLSKLI